MGLIAILWKDSYKFESEDMQKEVCKLVGYMAKKKGSKKNWKTSQTLYWRGKSYKRDSQEYQDLLTKAFDRLSTNKSFATAILSTGNSTLDHSIGNSDPSDTVLTRREFCRQLTRVRDKLKSK